MTSPASSSTESAIKVSADAVRKRAPIKPEIGLILGSGLGSLGAEVDGVRIPYGEIPNFPVSTVEGHAGEFCLGRLVGRNVAVMSGRFHFYEGYSLQQVTFPVRVMKELGCRSLIVTNAAGGINTNFNVGDLMLISDHLNNLGSNPLIGPNIASHGPRFNDMSTAYDAEYRAMARGVAKDLGIALREGVYVASTGPSYETTAEIRMLRTWGADAAGMSTVPEVIVARHAGMRVLGITCVTNMAAGILPQPLSHDEVIETTKRVKVAFRKFVLAVLERM